MAAPPVQGLPPWIDPERQHALTPRDGDVWISAPIKSGTNWMMNIVHQLLTGGDASFDSIYAVVPWPEFVERPGQPVEELRERIDALPTDRQRAFKSHSAPPELPFVKAGADVRYVVVCRNPEEALVSAKVFFEQHTDTFYDLWQLPKAALTRPNFPTFYHEVVVPRGMQGMFFAFVASWWGLRHEPNVLLMHFTDMKKDLSGTLRRVASFLGNEPRDAEWPAIEEHASFAWMKAHEHKFETHPYVPVPLLEPGAMIRKGQVGAARADGMTDEIAAHLRGTGSALVGDPAALRWLYEGGPIG